MREKGRQTGMDVRLENTPIITTYIAYFFRKHFFRADCRVQFAYVALWLGIHEKFGIGGYSTNYINLGSLL